MTAQKGKKRRSDGAAVLHDMNMLYYIIWLSTCLVCTHLMMSRFFRVWKTSDMHKSVLRTWFHTYKHTYYCAWIKWLLLRTSFLYYPNKWLHRRKKKEEAMVELYYTIWLSCTTYHDWVRACVVCTHVMMSRFFRILKTCDMHLYYAHDSIRTSIRIIALG